MLYLIIITNYFLLIRIKKILFNKYFFLLIIGLLLHGLIVNIVIGVPPNFMLAQVIGITIVGTYYYNFVSLYQTSEIIDTYIKMAFWVAVIGYPLYFFGLQIGNPGEERFCSFFKEPAHYVIVVLPACYYYLKTNNYLRFAIIFVTLILSSSSLGYIGCGLLFLLPNLTLKRIGYFFVVLPILIVTFYHIYSTYPFFKMRVDDTYKSYSAVFNGKFKEETNLSSYALMSNLYVAKSNVVDHPFGSGIGSHIYMHKNVYLSKMRPPKYLVTQNLQATNSTDANSMFTRVISEMGIIGFIIIVILMYYAFGAFASNKLFFAQGIVIYLLLKLFRDGHYFAPEFYFFVWLLYFTMVEHTKSKNLLI